MSSKTSAHRAAGNIEGYSILLHLENAPTLNSRHSSEKIESAKAQSVPHSLHGPDAAPNDFFFFAYLKEKLRKPSFTTCDDLIFAIWQILSEIPDMALKNLIPNWVTRSSWLMKKSGEHTK
jgi:hypothetical protein